LSVAGSFEHFARQLGLDDPQTLRLDSPFDYARQALCYLPAGLPDPNARDYTERVLDAVLPVLEASHGRAFLLFTSHRALRRAAELLAERVSWPLFVQGTAPRHQLLEEFRHSGHGVLLGAASFWEGVDVAGEALSVVVIDKLPFAAPDDPVLQARLEALESQGINPFMGWQVPTAAIALKQGAGRLIRDVHDRGVLVLCDPRLSSKGYGKLFLASLPPMPRTRELGDVTAFFGDTPAGGEA
jgi:ATP-dependent DNA helicase DinG